jgi:hypothetical protein
MSNIVSSFELFLMYSAFCTEEPHLTVPKSILVWDSRRSTGLDFKTVVKVVISFDLVTIL